MNLSDDVREDSGDRVSTRSKMPSKRLDQESVLLEKLRRLKNERSGYLSTVSARRKEIDMLLPNKENVQLVKEKLPGFLAAVKAFTEAHLAYSSNLQDEANAARCQEQFNVESLQADDFCQGVQEWITRAEEIQRLNSQINPEDSVSQIGSRATTKSSTRQSRRSSHSGSSRSSTSSLTVARAKEAARIAELKAEAAVFKKRQSLDEQRFRLQQEQERLALETEIAKSEAKEQVLVSIMEATPRSFVPNPSSLEPRPLGANGPLPVIVGRSNLNPEAPEWYQRPLITNKRECVAESDHSGASSSPSEKAFHEMLELHQHQNELQLQQNKIVEMLATQQKKSNLPQQRVPIFDGDPMEYGPFVRAFENIIESKTSTNSERLYYLQQFTSGDVKELVRSCDYLPPDKGYQEARRLMKKKFGDDYRIVTAYESKALNWPEVKAEDSTSLNRFSIFLMRCKNAMEGSKYLTKLEQPDTIQKLVMKLPFNLRKSWRRLVDNIMETEERSVMFRDLAEFVDNEARVIANPVFGKIVEDTKPKQDTRNGRPRNRFGGRETSLAAQVGSDLNTSPDAPSGPAPSTADGSCSFCNSEHNLESCEALRRRPYQERIQFLISKHLCFGCLSADHTARHCPRRKTCTVANCAKKHPTILHTNTAGRDGPPFTPSAGISLCEDSAHVYNGMVNLAYSKIGMAVVPVKVWSKTTKTPVITYAFLDSGSSSTFCTESLIKQLRVSGTRTQISLTTLERKNSLIDSFIVKDLIISDLDENVFITLPALYTRPEIPVSKEDIPTQDDVDQWPHLCGVHLPEVDAEIDLLIACDVPTVFDPLEVRHSEDGGPYASRTSIGWVVNGPLGRHHEGPRATSFFIKADPEFHQMVRDFYNGGFSESRADDKPEMSQEELHFLRELENTVVLRDGHYEMALPLRVREAPVPNNRPQAEQRALWLKRKLQRNKGLYNDYKGFMAEIIDKGYARKISADIQKSSNVKWYIPHHGIYHPQKPGKIRVVFDCSAKYQGKSLNDLLLNGPDLTNTLFGVLMRFRQERIALMADIESMFYQVRVVDADCTYLRFLWWPDGNLQGELQEYQMVVHLFGAASSPACSNFALRKTAEDNSKHFSEAVVTTVKRNFYVDDCLKSLPSVEEASQHASDLRSLLSRGGFRLTKWISNSRRVLETIPEVERAKEVKTLDLSKDYLPVERALGVRWCVETDTFGFKVDIKLKPLTRRGILSVVSSVYDPLGLAAPFMLPAKRLLQDLCRFKLDWDDPIPSEYKFLWERWTADLPKLSQFSVARCIKPAGFGVISSSQLHHFSDASEAGFGSVSYLRLVNAQEDVHCSFLCARSRVAPLKTITIPRLELSAAAISVKQDKVLRRELEIPIDHQSIFWTDSTAVLRYVRNETKRFHTFVANRVAVIRDGSEPRQWKHISGDMNPADDASRGLTADVFLRQERWLLGPGFLWKPEHMWPMQTKAFCDVCDDDPEVKTEVKVCMSSPGKLCNPLSDYFQKCSSWFRLKKVVAWLLRYRENLLNAIKSNKSERDDPKHITVEEMESAEREILKHVQREAFPEEFNYPNKPVKKSSRLRKLDPLVIDGLLRVGGRLRKASLPLESKNQIILPKEDHVTRLIIHDFHRMCGHSGREHVLALIRQKFWITQGSSTVKGVLAKCVSCRRRQAPLCQQKMADLPESRVLPDKPPFTSVGVDYFGPFQVRRGRSLVKRYGVIFTCLAIRAVHIEVAHSLDTDAFLLALRRFIARRGQVREIHSDNGTNFTSGERELRDAISNWNQEKIHNSLLQKNIKWSFNPPYGSHFGGIWERCIRTVRKILQALLREQITDDESLATLLCEVESIMNSRPITIVSSDPNDMEPLTPNHLLLLKSEISLPPGLFKREDLLSRRRWKQVQYLADVFWRRWSKEYLPLLQLRQKWVHPKRNLAVGDIVLIAAETSHRNSWPLGRIIETFPDKRGFVRRVKVRTQSAVYERPVDKLCLLVERECSNKEDMDTT